MKNSARKEALSLRRKLGADLRSDYSRIIQERLMASDWYVNAKNILCYASYNSEVDTSCIVEDILNSDKNMFLPRCITEKHELVVCPVNKLDELEKGAYGIIEPQGSGVDINIIDLVIVPVVAYNKNRMRIGYGAGYYDRLLADSDVKTIGIAFSVQETSFDDFEPTDVRLDMIITESEVLK